MTKDAGISKDTGITKAAHIKLCNKICSEQEFVEWLKKKKKRKRL
jgi:hypothetical protein